MKNFKDFAIIAGIVFVCFLVLFRKPTQIYKTTPTKIIKREIKVLKEQAQDNEKRIVTLKETLYSYKNIYDTLNIVRYQDSVIIHQDTQIVKLTEITKLQDTLIDKLEFDNKRFKRQRNIAIVVATVTTAAAILK